MDKSQLLIKFLMSDDFQAFCAKLNETTDEDLKDYKKVLGKFREAYNAIRTEGEQKREHCVFLTSGAVVKILQCTYNVVTMQVQCNYNVHVVIVYVVKILHCSYIVGTL